MMRYGVVAVLVSALMIACEATVPATTVPVSTAPPSLIQASEELPVAPSLVEQLVPAAPAATIIPPSASFSFDVNSGSAPLRVNFNNVFDGPITSTEWDFGDGTTSTDQSPSHRYTLAGTYTVQLTVSGPGGTDNIQMADLITVTPGSPISEEVSPSEAILAVQEETPFTMVARDQFGNVVRAPQAAGFAAAARDESDDGE